MNLADRVMMQMWPTPNAWDGQRGARSDKHIEEKDGQITLVTAVAQKQRETCKDVGQLNPEWVTWLMGYPKDYLNISEKSPQRSQELQQTKKTEQKN